MICIAFDDPGSYPAHVLVSFIQIAHNVTGKFVRNSDLHGYDRLKKNRRCIHEAFLECQDRQPS